MTTTDDPDIPVLPYEPPRKPVLTVYELASELRVGERSAYLLVASGQIRSVRVGPKGRGIRIPRAALDEFLAGEKRLAGGEVITLSRVRLRLRDYPRAGRAR